MKIISIIISIFLAQQIALSRELADLRKEALEGKLNCNGSIYSNETHVYYANKNVLNVVDLATKNEIAQITTSRPITAIKSEGDKLFVLTTANLEVWDVAGQKQISTIVTHSQYSAPYNFYEQPRGLALTADKIYIAHGVHGLAIIDRKSEKVEAIVPVKSTVRDIALVKDTAILIIDNNEEGGFHGFALMNLASNQIQKYIDVENVFPESITVLEDTLLVGYFSTIWKYRTQDVLTQSKPEVLARAFNFPAGPGSIVGKAFYDDKNMYACYESVNERGENPHKHIVIFDRKSLNL